MKFVVAVGIMSFFADFTYEGSRSITGPYLGLLGAGAFAITHREATEEIWPVPPYRVTSIEAQDCGGGWKFHIIHADTDEPFTAYTARETDSTGWFTLSEMRALRLHPGFRQWVEEHTPPDW
ncbi:MAG: hypothetical protein ACXVW7_12520 [Trebonia sp.]